MIKNNFGDSEKRFKKLIQLVKYYQQLGIKLAEASELACLEIIKQQTYLRPGEIKRYNCLTKLKEKLEIQSNLH